MHQSRFAPRDLILITALVAATFIWAAAPARAQNTVGAITAVAGEAHDERAGVLMAVTPGMAIELHDKLSTGPDGTIAITLSDNSKLSLSENGELVIDEHVLGATGAHTKTTLLGGTVRSVVNVTLRGGPPGFEVHTPNAIAGVRGTDFAVAYDEKPRETAPDCLSYTDVAVYRGTVEVINPQDPNAAPAAVTAGYETTVPCGQAPLTPGPLGVTGTSISAVGAGGEAFGGVAPVAPVPPPSCPVCIP